MSDLFTEAKRLEAEAEQAAKDINSEFAKLAENAKKIAADFLNPGAPAEVMDPDRIPPKDHEKIKEYLKARAAKLEEPSLNFGGASSPYMVSNCDPDTMNEIKKEISEDNGEVISGTGATLEIVEGPPDPVYRANTSRTYYPEIVGPIIESLIDQLGIIELDGRYGSQARTDSVSQGYKDQVLELETKLEQVENELAGADELRIGSRQDTIAANQVISRISSLIGFDLESSDRFELPGAVEDNFLKLEGTIRTQENVIENFKKSVGDKESTIESLEKSCNTYQQIAEQARADSKRPQVTKVFKPGDEENVLLVEKNNKLERDLCRLRESIEDIRDELNLEDSVSLEATLEIFKTKLKDIESRGESSDEY
jgi:hypothetical protein